MTIERMIELLNVEHQCMLRNAHGDCDRACASCDLVQDDGELHEMYTEVIALLKAQEPRVMTLEEVNRLEQNEVVWLEDNGIKEVIPAITVEHSHRYAQQSVCLMIVENPRLWVETFDYNGRWRCWTSEPTKEQREAAKWN